MFYVLQKFFFEKKGFTYVFVDLIIRITFNMEFQRKRDIGSVGVPAQQFLKVKMIR